MLRNVAVRMWALEPATYRSPADVDRLGDGAPRIPFPVYLIEHEDGLVLFDTGLDPDHVGDPGGAYGEMAERIDMRFDERHLIEAQIERWGFGLSEIGIVVASHLHFDHAGALKQFAHARVIIGEGEREYAHAPERFSSGWFRDADFDDRHGLDFDPIDADLDLFGDGAVTVLRLPGHTPGSVGMLVRLPEQRVILSGDAVHRRSAFQDEEHYHGDVDSVAARATLRRLAALESEQDARLWIAHDPDDWAAFGGAGEKR